MTSWKHVLISGHTWLVLIYLFIIVTTFFGLAITGTDSFIWLRKSCLQTQQCLNIELIGFSKLVSCNHGVLYCDTYHKDGYND